MRFKLVVAALVLLTLLSWFGTGRDTRPPNILLFIGDDIDFSYYGFQDHEFVRTPSLDRLASEGVVFDNGYASASACRPSLRTLLAGVDSYTWDQMARDIYRAYPGTHRYRESEHVPFTLPRLLRKAGYASFAGGKMWEGTFVDAGFDEGTIRLPPTGRGVDGANTFGRESMDPLYDFIDAQEGPWFAWVAPKLPHTPLDPPQDLADLYAGHGLHRSAVRYFGNVTRMDRRVGEILNFLDRRDLAENTVVVYLADNGWEQRLYRSRIRGGPLGADRGKLSVHDRGFRTPIVIRWPAEIRAGRRNDRFVTFEDVFETILDYAGAPSHECANGKSFRHLADDGSGAWEREHLFFRMDRVRYPLRLIAQRHADKDHSNNLPPSAEEVGYYMRHDRRWAYSFIPERGIEELYDLQEDPMGLENISDQDPVLLKRLRELALQGNEELTKKRCVIPSAKLTATR